jgi:hypothetical protein
MEKMSYWCDRDNGYSFVAGMILSILVWFITYPSWTFRTLCLIAFSPSNPQSTLFLLTMNTSAFAILYSIGNIISLFSLTFVVGIPKQLKTMFAPVRFWATVVYIALLIITLAVSILVSYNFNYLKFFLTRHSTFYINSFTALSSQLFL